MTGISHCFPMSFPIEKPASVGLLDGLEELQRLLRRLDPTSHLGWECNKQYNILIWTYLLFVLFIHIIWTIHIDIIDTNICSNNYVYIYTSMNIFIVSITSMIIYVHVHSCLISSFGRLSFMHHQSLRAPHNKSRRGKSLKFPGALKGDMRLETVVNSG